MMSIARQDGTIMRERDEQARRKVKPLRRINAAFSDLLVPTTKRPTSTHPCLGIRTFQYQDMNEARESYDYSDQSKLLVDIAHLNSTLGSLILACLPSTSRGCADRFF